jgi:hypothetical protein
MAIPTTSMQVFRGNRVLAMKKGLHVLQMVFILTIKVNDLSEYDNEVPNGGLAPGSSPIQMIYRGGFDLNDGELKGEINWMYSSIGNDHWAFK